MDTIAGIMATSGIEALSMREIARQTDMTAANLYNYFDNKQQLFVLLRSLISAVVLSLVHMQHGGSVRL